MGWQNRHKLVAAVYVIIEKDNQLLLLRRINTGYGDGMYSLPSGHMEPNEGAIAAAVREAKEETGVRIQPEDVELAHVITCLASQGDHERVSYFFKAKRFSGTPRNMEPDKCDQIKFTSYNKLPDNMVWEVEQALAKIKLGEIYSEANYLGN